MIVFKVITPDIGPSMSPVAGPSKMNAEAAKLEPIPKEEFLPEQAGADPAKSPSILERALIKEETQQPNDLSGGGDGQQPWNPDQQMPPENAGGRPFDGRDGRTDETMAPADPINTNNSDSNRPINFIQPFDSHQQNHSQQPGFAPQENSNMTGWMR